MEPDRYWFLYLGLLFIFLGSEIGQSICLRAMYLVRACFYLALALLLLYTALLYLAIRGSRSLLPGAGRNAPVVRLAMGKGRSQRKGRQEFSRRRGIDRVEVWPDV